jgi:(p)ppGpp synthase/HD superfamily hydrolase
MNFARLAHADQRRKYTNAPYTDHLAEVAGIVATLPRVYYHPQAMQDEMVAAAWLHDVIEDQGVTAEELSHTFGPIVAGGVLLLSDLETEGNRATRKAAARDRLAEAPSWIQSIKVADMISNTASIVQHDPGFARVYLEEKRLLLDVLTGAHPALLAIAREQL